MSPEQDESDEMHRQNEPHYFPRHPPYGEDDCPFCEGDGCEECDGLGIYTNLD